MVRQPTEKKYRGSGLEIKWATGISRIKVILRKPILKLKTRTEMKKRKEEKNKDIYFL